MKLGLVLEGGAKRGIFTAGVLKVLQEQGIFFSYVVGVSAGSGNLINWIANQPERMRKVINPPKNDSYCGFRTLLHTGKALDLDKMFKEYPTKQYPLDFDTYFRNIQRIDGEIVVTACETGKACYCTEKSDQNRLMLLGKASCSVPLLVEPVELDGLHYMDGSIVDSIPFARAFEKGCDKVLVIKTRRREEPPSDFRKFKAPLRKIYSKDYPAFFEACMNRVDNYNRQHQVLDKLIEEGKAFLIQPELKSIGRFDNNAKRIDDFFLHGENVMREKLSEFSEFVKEGSEAE